MGKAYDREEKILLFSLRASRENFLNFCYSGWLDMPKLFSVIFSFMHTEYHSSASSPDDFQHDAVDRDMVVHCNQKWGFLQERIRSPGHRYYDMMGNTMYVMKPFLMMQIGYCKSWSPMGRVKTICSLSLKSTLTV